METGQKEKLFTLSQFRRELGIPLIVAKKLVTLGEVEAQKALDGTLRVAESEVKKIADIVKNPWEKSKLFFRTLGPGVVTGASDDDPGGIGTYSSVGAKFGLAIIWMAVWLLPIMLAVQEICARIGIVTNRGLAGVLGRHYRKRIVISIIVLLIVANIINIGADLGAMAASLKMLLGVDFFSGVIFFSLASILLEVFLGYRKYVKFLKWMTLSVFSYVIAGFVINPEWRVIFGEMFVPHIEFSKEYIFAMIAVFGTTITPYLFFWQTSEEVEENKLKGSTAGSSDPVEMKPKIARMRTDVGTGMILANAVFFFVILTTAQVLFKNGITNIESAEQAAQALRPLAGDYAYLFFALGIIGTGLLAVPVLAGSGAYAFAEVMKWSEGLGLKFSKARGFYLVIASSIILGMLFNLLHINSIAALYWSAFINGIIALPLLIVIMIVGDDPKIMGEETNPGWVRIFGWAGVIFMILTVLTFLTFQLLI